MGMVCGKSWVRDRFPSGTHFVFFAPRSCQAILSGWPQLQKLHSIKATLKDHVHR